MGGWDNHEQRSTNTGQASASEGVVATEETKRVLDRIRANRQTTYLEAHAEVEGRRHHGETVKPSHNARSVRLEKDLKEAEVACSIAESCLVSGTKMAKIQAIVRTTSLWEFCELI
jgi:hypothetical protein